MSISRDEAREIAIMALLATIMLRAGVGVVQLIEELSGEWTFTSLLGRLFAPIGATPGILTLGAALLVTLSPNGSITPGMTVATRRVAALMFALGIGASFHTLAFSTPRFLTQLWIAMLNGLAAAILSGAAYWILKNFDGER